MDRLVAADVGVAGSLAKNAQQARRHASLADSALGLLEAMRRLSMLMLL
jgi:hypothetical protein